MKSELLVWYSQRTRKKIGEKIDKLKRWEQLERNLQEWKNIVSVKTNFKKSVTI